MKVILLKEQDNLGAEGEIVNVKNGYGRNYLIPKGIAALATKSAVQAWEEEQRQAARKIAQRKGDAETVAKQLESTEVVIPAKVGEENRIFGTVTAQQVADALSAKGFEVDRRKIDLSEDIRMIGVYSATVKLHPEVTAQVKVRVTPESGPEAEAEEA